MTAETLEMINNDIVGLGIEYEYMRYNGNNDTYFVGEYSEVSSPSESGMSETNFIINGFTELTWLSLEEAKEAISELYGYTGKTVIHPSGVGVAVFFDNSFPVELGNAEDKRLQINLLIKEWKVK